MERFDCPHCGKPMIERNIMGIGKGNDIVIKSRLVFLNEDKNVLAKCQNCKRIIGLPLQITKETDINLPQNRALIDL